MLHCVQRVHPVQHRLLGVLHCTPMCTICPFAGSLRVVLGHTGKERRERQGVRLMDRLSSLDRPSSQSLRRLRNCAFHPFCWQAHRSVLMSNVARYLMSVPSISSKTMVRFTADVARNHVPVGFTRDCFHVRRYRRLSDFSKHRWQRDEVKTIYWHDTRYACLFKVHF